MPGIADPIPNYEFGTTADYSTWRAETTLTLCNVPWNNDYRDIVLFEDGDTLDAYIDGLPSLETHPASSYARINQPIRISTPFPVAQRFNYIRVKNAKAPFDRDEPTAFYYFITDVQYLAPETTLIVVQLDVWSTFGSLASFGRCWIERGHIGIANENGFRNYGRDYLTVPEGLDTGSDYRVLFRQREVVMDVGSSGDENISPMVLVLSTVNLFASNGTADNPSVTIARPSEYSNIPLGMGAFFMETVEDFLDLIDALKDKPWVIEGIYSVSVVPPVTRYHGPLVISTQVIDGKEFRLFHPSDEAEMREVKLYEGWRDTDYVLSRIPARYRRLRKFFTFPYMMIEATTWNGSSLVIRPELWNDPDATFTELASLIPPGQRVTFAPRWYNASVPGFEYPGGDDNGEHLNMSISLDSFLTIPVMNNAGALALAQNARGLAFERQSAEWSQQRAQAGIATSYDQASNAIATSTAQTDLSNRSARQQTDFANNMRWAGVITGGVGGAGAGALAGGVGAVAGAVGGAALSAVNTGLQNHQASTMQSMAAASASESNRIAGQSASFVRDTNRDLAQFAARGDYQNTIAGQSARIQDTLMTQPSVKGNLGGDLLRAINDMTELSVRWKMVDLGTIRRIGEFWLRYGYAVNEFAALPSSLNVMSHFTYWKLSETYITTAPMPETYKHTLRGIFEKGVTVWRRPEHIGTIDPADNMPLEGITL